MVKEYRADVQIDGKKEMRTKEISRMIDEGGLGAEKYYNINKINTPQEDEEQQTLTYVINQLIANQGVLFVKLHQYHWYVQGPDFFTLHEKFEELYNETSTYFDMFAERLIAKGKKPFSTLGEYLEHATISEKAYDEQITVKEMVSQLIEDYKAIISLLLEGIDLSGKGNDAVTEDMLIGYKEHIDKTIWMLQAYLGNE